jgi:hypothetical protein
LLPDLLSVGRNSPAHAGIRKSPPEAACSSGRRHRDDGVSSTPTGDTGLADVAVLQRRAAARADAGDEHGFYLETVSEYLWARDVAGLAPATPENLIKPVLELCSFYCPR